MHYAAGDGTGRTISEFPLIYYSVAKSWKLFGKSEGAYRGYILLYFLTALFALYRTIGDLLKDRFLGLWVALLLFTSPTLVYYSFNFLPNIPALSSVLIAWALFFQYSKRSHFLWLVLSFMFFTIGALLKTSAALSLIALFGVFVMDRLAIIKLNQNKKNPIGPLYIFIGCSASFATIMSWYLYARSYNSAHNADLFMYMWGALWELNGDEISTTIRGVKDHFLWSYFRPITYWVLGAFGLIVLNYYRKIPRSVLLLLVLSSLGALIFFILFFKAFNEHDYYTIDLFILVPILSLAFFGFAIKKWPNSLNSWGVRIVLIILIVHNADFAQRRMEWRYSGWMDQSHSRYTYKFEDVEKILRKNEIKRDDLVISMPDPSLNNSLYAMDQKGWSGFKELLMDSVKIKEKIEIGASVLIITDTLANDPHIVPFTKKLIAEHEGLLIYDLRDY